MCESKRSSSEDRRNISTWNMASPNVASSSMPYPSGNVVVVTHVLPAAPSGEQQPPLDRRHNFSKGHPKALGTVQIMIGLMTLLFGIATAVYQPSLGVYSGLFAWGALFYLASGSVTVAAEITFNHCLIVASLTLNIMAALVAVSGVVLYSLDPVVWYNPFDDDDHYHYGGYSAVMAVFQFLEFIVSITVAAYACHATCSCCCCCCTEQPQPVIRTVEGQIIAQAPLQFPAAAVVPAQPSPQVVPNFNIPGDLGSAEPPAYQPNWPTHINSDHNKSDA